MDNDENLRINIGYPLGQLLRAELSPSPKAATRAAQWRQVIAGLLTGALKVGSRTPVADMPPWVTLEVVTGGFATGGLAAGGQLQPHETLKLRSVLRPEGASDRAALNLFYMSDQGAPELATMLESGQYRISVPEEGALLAAVWLNRHGEADRSAALLETILPFFDRLRFYPIPHERPLKVTRGLSVQTAEEAAGSLRAKRVQPDVAAMTEAIQVWAPLYDRAVALVAETVDGDIPTFERDAEGRLVSGADRQPVVRGGRPCQRFPSDWHERAEALLQDYAVARRTHALSGNPDNPKSGFARLRRIILRCTESPAKVSAGDAETARTVLAGYTTKFGGPALPRLAEIRANQQRNAARPSHHVVARVVADRLAAYPSDEGVPDPAPLTAEITDEESLVSGIPANTPLPPSIERKAMRCFLGSFRELVERGIVTSAEAMAPMLPTLTARARAESIADPALQRLFWALYVAFRRRRSLLLLDLESQVRFEELPWVAALEPWIASQQTSRQAALGTLVEAAQLALATFPQTILPNKLVKEFDALQRAAGLRLPLVEELAADIFMGEFSEKFLLAAQVAGRLLRGTLYERYYDIPYASVLQLDDVVRPERGAPRSPGFAALCKRRGSSGGPTWSVARNGTIIEQAEIITTHNLAALFEVEGVRSALAPHLPDLARACFRWICRRLQVWTDNWHAEMQNVKDAAYAWRQTLFYLSVMDASEIEAFQKWAHDHVREQEPAFQARFVPVMAGLDLVLAGSSFGADGRDATSGGRRFLGWSVGRHWLLRGQETEAAISSGSAPV